MHITVLGAGALGGYFGSRWEQAGANVTYLVRNKRAKQLERNGLNVSSPRGDYQNSEPTIITDANQIDHTDLVFVSVKGYHLDGIMDQLKILTEKGAFVLPVLNGMEHIPVLKKELGEETVLGGLSFIMATLDDAGHVVHSSDFHRLIFGKLHAAQTEVCGHLEKLCEKTDLEFINSDSILHELWKKYTFINAFSGITTAVNLPIGPILEKPDTFRVARKILLEMQQLAGKYDIKITDEELEEANQSFLELNSEATSSMHQDRRKGLPLEVDHLHGGAVRLADDKGLELPYINAIYGIIKPFERV
ncbi:ketopantoate reductase family protein [Virgibacillus siamensis]|uniref:ketopantoate reductase family protein n=1 Tax=Virgibacillus siamensis TaxID=480071 RepID=UPI0009871E28|nr:2-dehydropantoate 2-reductase [Virgibacillus siamensis]